MDLTLSTTSDPLASTIVDTEYVGSSNPKVPSQANLAQFLARRAVDHKHRYLKINEDPHVTKVMDALKNREFELAKKSAKVIGMGLIAGTGRISSMVPPEFDLQESAAVYDAEPYFRAAVGRQINIWFKQGFKFISNNPALSEYITRRFDDMSFVTGITTHQLFKQIVRDLLKFGNAFVYKHRDADLAPLAKQKEGRRAPVCGYFPMSAMNMYPLYDRGRLKAWIRYLNDGTELEEISPQDVIHFTFDREPDFLFGKPRILGAVEDIAALRRIEENVEVLLVKYLFPIFQFTVGTEDAPAQYLPDGTSEIDIAKALIEEMNQEGLLVGTERHKLEVVGAKSAGLDARHYLAHFKSRVLTALGVSPLDMGEGGQTNRSSADNISQNLKERVMEDQRDFVDQIQHFMIAELFIEHPEDRSAANSYHKVSMWFPEVDLDNLIKKQTHITALWNNDLLTETEAREELGRQPIQPDERSQMRFSMIDVPMAIISAVDEPWTKEAKAAVKARSESPTPSGSGSATTKKSSSTPKIGSGQRGGQGPTKKKKGKPAANAVSTLIQPTNQYGKNPGPTKRKSSMERDMLGDRLVSFITMSMLFQNNVEMIEDTIDMYFQEVNQRKIIKDIFSKIDMNTIDMKELRAFLVSELIPYSDEFKDGTN